MNYGETEENTTTEFHGVFAYSFFDELCGNGNIIFDITSVTLESFLSDNHEILTSRKNYGWPCMYDNSAQLMELLINDQLRYFIIQSSHGLHGWILAQKINVIVDGEQVFS